MAGSSDSGLPLGEDVGDFDNAVVVLCLVDVDFEAEDLALVVMDCAFVLPGKVFSDSSCDSLLSIPVTVSLVFGVLLLVVAVDFVGDDGFLLEDWSFFPFSVVVVAEVAPKF